MRVSARRSSSWSLAWVAWTTVVCGPRQPASSRTSIGRRPCSARHSSISRGCSSACTWRTSCSRLAVSPTASSQSIGQARTECGARPTRAPLSRSCATHSRYAVDGILSEARDTASAVGDEQQHELDPGRLRSLDRGGAPPRARCSETRRQPCTRPRASRGTCARRSVATCAGVTASASAIIACRQAQKSSPSTRPRSARWKVWLCAFTKPGSVSSLMP